MSFDGSLPPPLPEGPTTWALDRQLFGPSNLDGFFEFCKAAWPQIESVPLVCERHMYELARHYQALAQGDIKRLLVNIPPGFSKSVMACVLLPAWIWTWWPDCRILTASYDRTLVGRDSEKSRNLVTSDWYQARWEIELDTTRTKLYYRNRAHGYRLATTVRGGLTGFHFDLAIVDDPQKPLGMSRVTLEQESVESALAWQWYSETLATRFSDHATARKLIIMQRLSMADLAQRVLDSEEHYEHLCLPMRYVPERRSRTSVGGDWRFLPGELLAPERYGPEALASLEEGMADMRTREAQLQQNPIPGEGVYFREEHFQRFAELPDQIFWCSAWDFAVKASGGSWNVGQCWARLGRDRYLVAQTRFKGTTVDMVRGLKDFHDACRERFDALQRAGKLKHFELGAIVEEKAAGPAVLDMLRDEQYDAELKPYNPGRASKEDRAEACMPTVARGQVHLPADGSLDEALARIVAFPGAVDKDEVDVMTMVLISWMGEGEDGLDFLSSLPSVR